MIAWETNTDTTARLEHLRARVEPNDRAKLVHALEQIAFYAQQAALRMSHRDTGADRTMDSLSAAWEQMRYAQKEHHMTLRDIADKQKELEA